MKFLSEFGACWGGATITPPQTETIDNLPQPETTETAGSQSRAANRHESSGQIRSINATNAANWKPTLHAICEERVLSDSNFDGGIHGTDRMNRYADKKSSAKIKANTMTRVSAVGEGFRRSYRIAMNAFAPTPFLI